MEKEKTPINEAESARERAILFNISAILARNIPGVDIKELENTAADLLHLFNHFTKVQPIEQKTTVANTESEIPILLMQMADYIRFLQVCKNKKYELSDLTRIFNELQTKYKKERP